MTITLPTGLDQARDLLAAHDARAAQNRTADEAVRDRHETGEELLFAHLRDMVLHGQAAAWFLITPNVVARELDYEIEVDLTRAERDRVVDDVMNSPAIDDLMATVNSEFRELVREIVQHVLGQRTEQ